MTYDTRHENRRNYEKASEQYRGAKRALDNCEGMKANYNRNKWNLEKRLAEINEIITDLSNDTREKITLANQKTRTAKEDYDTAIHNDLASAADISQSFYTDTNLDEELGGLIAERKRLEAEIERIGAEIARLTRKIEEYSSQMARYKQIMNQYG